MRPFSKYLNTNQIHPLVVDWTKRVVKNGGVLPGQKTVRSLNNLWVTLIKNQLDTKLKLINCLVPDNLTAALTPLYQIANGNDPWTNTNFLSTDLTKDGLIGNGSSKYLNPNLLPSNMFPDDDTGGMTLYNMSASDVITPVEFGASQSIPQFAIYVGYNGVSYCDIFANDGTGRISADNSLFTGFLSGNRISSTSFALYQANSGMAFNTLVSNSTGDANGTRPTTRVPYVFAFNADGSPAAYTPRRLSFVAAHLGLTDIEAQIFYNAVQTMRTQLGGGYV